MKFDDVGIYDYNKYMPDDLVEKVAAGAMIVASSFPVIDKIRPAQAENIAPEKSIVADVGTLPEKPQLTTPNGKRIVIPGISFDGNSQPATPPKDIKAEAMDWLTRDNKAVSYHDGPMPDRQLGFNRRDCDEVRQDIAACTSDFGYGETAPGIFQSTFGVLDEKAGDGWDVMKVGGKYVSIIYTKDHTGTQVFLGENCKIGDGWILFPADFLNDLQDGKKGNATVPIKRLYLKEDGSFECPPAENYDKTYTEWEYVENYIYNDGSVEPTIKVFHYHSADKENSGREEFYFNKKQGLAAWAHVDEKGQILDSHAWTNEQKSTNSSWPYDRNLKLD